MLFQLLNFFGNKSICNDGKNNKINHKFLFLEKEENIYKQQIRFFSFCLHLKMKGEIKYNKMSVISLWRKINSKKNTKEIEIEKKLERIVFVCFEKPKIYGEIT